MKTLIKERQSGYINIKVDFRRRDITWNNAHKDKGDDSI